MKYSREELLRRLQDNLSAERIAVKVYHHESQRVRDTDIALLLKGIAYTEAYHASLLAQAIRGLGGVPASGTDEQSKELISLVDSMKTDEDILRLNIILENKAFNTYKEDAFLADDPQIAQLLERIMKDEKEHVQLFTQALMTLRREDPEDEEGPLLVFQKAVDAGIKRLSRPWLEMFMSGVIGAIHVTFGAVAMASAAGAVHHEWLSPLVGALFFPIGFILLKLSHSELFTENFLVPVVPVLEAGERASKLIKLWILTLLGNLVGACIFALLVYLGGRDALGHLPVDYIKELTAYKLSRPFHEALISAVFAGAIITTMTWLVLSVKSEVAKLIAVWSCIFVMAVGHFTHVVVSTSEILLGSVYGVSVNLVLWFKRLFVPATLGNTLGGMLLIALLHYLQVLHTKKAHFSYLRERNEALERAVRERLRL